MDLAKVMSSVTGLENGHVDQGLGRLETCGRKSKTSLWNCETKIRHFVVFF